MTDLVGEAVNQLAPLATRCARNRMDEVVGQPNLLGRAKRCASPASRGKPHHR